MNTRKQQELEENIRFMREQFSKLEAGQRLPERISAQSMRERALRTQLQPKPSVSFFRGQWGRRLAAACVFVLVAVTAWRYAVRDAGQMVQQAQDNEMQDRMIAMQRDLPESAQLDSDVLFDRDEKPESDQNPAFPAQEQAEQEEQAASSSDPTASNHDVFFTYDEIRRELFDGEQKDRESSITVFGENVGNELESITSARMLPLEQHTLYFCIDPQTQEKTDALFVLDAKTGETIKRITLPPKSKMDISLHVSDDERYAILTAAEDRVTHMGILSLQDLNIEDYVVSGSMDQCWLRSNVLYLVTSLSVDEELMQGDAFIPYTVFHDKKQLIPASRIYRLRDGSDPSQFTVLSALDLNTKKMESLAVLCDEAQAKMLPDEICITSEGGGSSLTFSYRTLAPK